MPMITKPASIEKNSAAEITLDKSVLADIDSVSNDLYFGDSTNWSEVLIYFRSSEGNQREILKFDATQASPTANFLVSDKARDAFEVQKIVIKDFDNDSFTVTRSELVVADFDITLGGGGGGEALLLTWSSVESPSRYTTTTSSVTKTVGNNWDFNIISNETLSGNIEISFTLNPTASTAVVGFQSVPSSTSGLGAIDYGVFIDSGFGVANLNFHYKNINGSYFNTNLNQVYNAGDVLTLKLEGSMVTVLVNSTLIFSGTIGVNLPNGRPLAANYSMGISIFDQNASVENIIFRNI